MNLGCAEAPGLAMPNVIVHVARIVHTPDGSAPSGMICWQPNLNDPPAVMGLISHDPQTVGQYFGLKIFAGTPFEIATGLAAKIEVDTARAPDEVAAASASLTVNGKEVPVILSPAGISGEPAAAWSPCGVYVR